MSNVEYTLKISSFHAKEDMQPFNQEPSSAKASFRVNASISNSHKYPQKTL